MSRAKSDTGVTPSQTVGPFFRDGMAWLYTVASAEQLGEDDVLVEGAVLDGDAQPVDDALLEIWQPDAAAESDGRLVPGFQRVATDAAGRFAFVVRRSGGGAAMAHVIVMARGLLRALRTRVYLGVSADELRTLEALRDVPEPALATLIAAPCNGRHEWSVRLQGPDETLFFELI
jgi:protocatechuate 3,4-dioxygenase, alpha subunit